MPWDKDQTAYRTPEEQHGFELLGAAVRRRRRFLRLTQSELARRARIDQSVLSRIERGGRWGIGWRRFARLVDALGGLDFGPPGARPVVPPDRIVPDWRREAEEALLRSVEAAAELDDDEADEDFGLVPEVTAPRAIDPDD
jgi:transcriptional regulator with XRE-family HTH domain